MINMSQTYGIDKSEVVTDLIPMTEGILQMDDHDLLQYIGRTHHNLIFHISLLS